MGRKARGRDKQPRERRGPARPLRVRQRYCQFCKDKVEYVDFKDVSVLRKYISDRGKIRARRITGNCVQHQRDVSLAVKNAREMALLPYVSR